jgi:hypothetical protein
MGEDEPTEPTTWPELLANWYRGEEIDRHEAVLLWLRTLVAIGGLWMLSYLAPS